MSWHNKWDYLYGERIASLDQYLMIIGNGGWEVVTVLRNDPDDKDKPVTWDIVAKRFNPNLDCQPSLVPNGSSACCQYQPSLTCEPSSCQSSSVPKGEWKEISKPEVMNTHSGIKLKPGELMSDYDILTKWMKYSSEEAEQMIARLKKQRLEELKLQVMAQNPQLLGVGMPGEQEKEPNLLDSLLGGIEEIGKKVREAFAKK